MCVRGLIDPPINFEYSSYLSDWSNRLAVMAKKMRFGKDGFVGMSDHNVSATDREYGY